MAWHFVNGQSWSSQATASLPVIPSETPERIIHKYHESVSRGLNTAGPAVTTNLDSQPDSIIVLPHAHAATSRALAHLQSPASSCPAMPSCLERYARKPGYCTGSSTQADPPDNRRAPTLAVRLLAWYLGVHSLSCTYTCKTILTRISCALMRMRDIPIDDLVALVANAIVSTGFVRAVVMHPVAVVCHLLPTFGRRAM